MLRFARTNRPNIYSPLKSSHAMHARHYQTGDLFLFLFPLKYKNSRFTVFFYTMYRVNTNDRLKIGAMIKALNQTEQLK